MKYKKGNKVLCIKDFIHFEKNEAYFISIVGNNSLYVCYREDGWGLWFNINNNKTYLNNFQDYFLTESDLRRKKLDKINEKG